MSSHTPLKTPTALNQGEMHFTKLILTFKEENHGPGREAWLFMERPLLKFDLAGSLSLPLSLTDPHHSSECQSLYVFVSMTMSFLAPFSLLQLLTTQIK